MKPAVTAAQRHVQVLTLPADAQREPGWSLLLRDAALAALHKAIGTTPAGTVIISSEGYLGEAPPREPQGVWGDLLEALRHGGQSLLLGAPIAYRDPLGAGLLNGVLMLSPDPQGGALRSAVYAKQQLAPGGETIPWPGLLAPLLRQLGVASVGTELRAAPDALSQPLFVAGESVALSLCHELAYGHPLARQSMQAGWLVNMAYDAWLADFGYQLQVDRLARLRALELGKALLRVSQGSGSLLVDADGSVLGEWPGKQQALLHVPVRDRASPYARWAGLQAAAALLGLAGLALLALVTRLTSTSRSRP